MAQHRNTLLVQLDSPAIWLSDIKGFREIRPGSACMGAPNAGGVGYNWRLLTDNWLYLEDDTR